MQASGCNHRNYYVGGKVAAIVVAASRQSLLALAVKEQGVRNTGRGANPLQERVQRTTATCVQHGTVDVNDESKDARSPWKKGLTTTIYPSTKPRCPSTNQSTDATACTCVKTPLHKSNLGISEAYISDGKPLQPEQALPQTRPHHLHVPESQRERSLKYSLRQTEPTTTSCNLSPAPNSSI